MDFLMRKMTGIAGPIKNGVPSDAFIESIADTGTTITSPSVGPEAPVYQLGLQVTPDRRRRRAVPGRGQGRHPAHLHPDGPARVRASAS